MRNMLMAVAAAGLLVPATVTFSSSEAQATSAQRERYREWRGRDGRRYCRKPDGTTGLVVGGVAGALLGRTIDTRGDRTLGTLGGAAAGALAGRTIERETGKRCR